MPVPQTIVYGAALLLCTAAGAVLLDALLRDEADESRRRDVALALGPVCGLLLLAFPGWVLTAFFRVPFELILGLGAAAVVGTLFALRDRVAGLLGRGAWTPVALGALVFALFLFLRLGVADIRQTEKPMDAAVLGALLTTPSLPLADPWFAGTRFPYYHFGTYVQALPLRLAGVPPEYGYNYVAGLLAALTALAAFGAVRTRGGGRKVATAAALLLVLGGTFDGARQLLAGTPLGGIDPWPSSRRVENTITEWPLFSLWLGDLHPHVMSLPFLVALAALAGRAASRAGILLDGVLLAALLSANPWDLPAGLLVLAAGALAERPLRAATARGTLAAAAAAPLLLASLLAPRPAFQGIRAVTQKTTSPEAFLHFGVLLLVPALALGAALVRSRRDGEQALFFATLFPAVGVALAVVTKRPVLGLAAAALLAIVFLLKSSEGATRAGLLFLGCGAALVAIPEVVAVSDPYGEQFHRMNTVFKTYAGAAPLFALATGLLLPLLFSLSRARWTVRVLAAVALLGALAQPVSFLVDRVKNPKGTLDGLAWMTREAPGDRAAIVWLRKNAPPRAVVVEAVGGAYSDHGRIGTFSGRPTLLGWTNHEGLWRGEKGGPEVQAREADVKTIYQSPDEARVREILRQRGVSFVTVGPLERAAYGPYAFPLRDRFKKVVQAEGTELYDAAAPMQQRTQP